MKEITKEALLEALKLRDTGEHPAFRECEFKDMDLSGADLHNMELHIKFVSECKSGVCEFEKQQCGKCIV